MDVSWTRKKQERCWSFLNHWESQSGKSMIYLQYDMFVVSNDKFPGSQCLIFYIRMHYQNLCRGEPQLHAWYIFNHYNFRDTSMLGSSLLITLVSILHFSSECIHFIVRKYVLACSMHERPCVVDVSTISSSMIWIFWAQSFWYICRLHF